MGRTILHKQDGLNIPQISEIHYLPHWMVPEKQCGLVQSSDLKTNYSVELLCIRGSTYHGFHVYYLDLYHEPELCQIMLEQCVCISPHILAGN
jgi:hypothetical protein